MLLEDCIKNTENHHPDAPLLNTALSELLQVAKKVNEAVMEQENRDKLLKVAKKFQDFKELEVAHKWSFVADF